MQFIKRFFSKPAQSFFLFGPRGTGKSTLVREYFKDALWVDLLHPETLRSYSARPERLFELVKGSPDKKVVVIDEVQKVPSLDTKPLEAFLTDYPMAKGILLYRGKETPQQKWNHLYPMRRFPRLHQTKCAS